jgi:predicted hydrocarbon binding protein
MAATVDALLPLSLLTAVRDVDRPVDDPDTEFVAELRNKRFGLSDTVHAQIGRYTELVRRRERLGSDEVSALARLIGRRPDAEVVFRAAGQHLAREAFRAAPGPTRGAAAALPSLLSQPLVLRHLRQLVRRYLGGTVRRVGGSLLLDVPTPIAVEGAPPGAACAYYEASFRELLRLLQGEESVVEHVRCTDRAEGRCEWRVEWRR